MAESARYVLPPGGRTCICTNRAFDRFNVSEILYKMMLGDTKQRFIVPRTLTKHMSNQALCQAYFLF